MILLTCGDICPNLSLNTDTKYNKRAPDTQYIKQVCISQINIYFMYNIHTCST